MRPLEKEKPQPSLALSSSPERAKAPPVCVLLDAIGAELSAAADQASEAARVLAELARRLAAEVETPAQQDTAEAILATTEDLAARARAWSASLNERLEHVLSQQDQLAETQRFAFLDALTGLLNRRAFDERLEQLIGGRRCFSVMLADIDHFKQINDTFGHDAGDRVLQRVARRLKAGVRRTDVVARYGGEEFAILLPSTGLPEAMRVAEHLRAHLADGQQRRAGDQRRLSAVTVSIGVAEWTPGQSAAALLRQADQALYQAKRSGRNRVEAATGQLALLID